MICEKCHAGQMTEYKRKIHARIREITITDRKCDRCGYMMMDNDDDVFPLLGFDYEKHPSCYSVPLQQSF